MFGHPAHQGTGNDTTQQRMEYDNTDRELDNWSVQQQQEFPYTVQPGKVTGFILSSNSMLPHELVSYRYGDDSCVNDGTVEVCKQVLESYNKLFPSGPKYGHLPIHFVSGPTPRAIVNRLPEHYVVAVTCLTSRKYNQLIFQVGHEFAHHFVDPLVDHPFFEVVAVALSLFSLDIIARQWMKRGLSKSKREYSDKLIEYKDTVIRYAYESCKVSSVNEDTSNEDSSSSSNSQKSLMTLEYYVSKFLPKNAPTNPSLLHNRATQVILADEMLQKVFYDESEDILATGRLECLKSLTDYIAQDGNIDFAAWKNAEPAVVWNFANNLQNLFESYFSNVAQPIQWEKFHIPALFADKPISS